jgi:flagellar biosynthetic protein FliQ
MDQAVVIDLFREAFMLVIISVSVIVVPSLLVGLLVSTFQAATQINEQTLSFLPRLIVTIVTIMLAGPWMMNSLVEYMHRLITSIPQLIG